MKIRMVIEFDIDADSFFGTDDPEAREWFFDEILKNDLHLHSNEIGETITDEVMVVSVEEIKAAEQSVQPDSGK